MNHILGQILQFYPIIIFSKLPEVIGDESFNKLKKHLNKQLKRHSQLDAWRDDEKDDKEDLRRENSKIYGRNAHYLNDLLYLSLQFMCLNFKLRNFQRVNQVSFKEDNYLTEKLSKFQLLKGEFSRAVSNEGQNGVEFERILQEVAVLSQDLSGYEMIKSQKPLINDWIESDYLLHKALPLDMKIGNMVHQIQSTEIGENEK